MAKYRVVISSFWVFSLSYRFRALLLLFSCLIIPLVPHVLIVYTNYVLFQNLILSNIFFRLTLRIIIIIIQILSLRNGN